jgi:hypothetical protein
MHLIEDGEALAMRLACIKYCEEPVAAIVIHAALCKIPGQAQIEAAHSAAQSGFSGF